MQKGTGTRCSCSNQDFPVRQVCKHWAETALFFSRHPHSGERREYLAIQIYIFENHF